MRSVIAASWSVVHLEQVDHLEQMFKVDLKSELATLIVSLIRQSKVEALTNTCISCLCELWLKYPHSMTSNSNSAIAVINLKLGDQNCQSKTKAKILQTIHSFIRSLQDI
jgi:predicted neuraminidase